MREKMGRRKNPKSLDPIGEDETHGVTGKEGKCFFSCYLLTSLSPRHKGHTYIGFTVNPKRRIRQHNGEISSGAWRTKKKRPWEMVFCIYGFPTNISALQFEWAWQHPRESLAVREAAAAFKSFSGIASKVKLAYTMLTLPAWNSFNLTVNYFSTKYAHLGGLSPSLPLHMKVKVCAMDDLPCFTKPDSYSQPEEEDEASPEGNEEEEEEEDDDVVSSNQSQPGNLCTSLWNDLYPVEKAKGPETVSVDRLASFTGFGSSDESIEVEVSNSIVGSVEAMEKEPKTVADDDRLANFTGFGLLEEIPDDEVSHSTVISNEAIEKDSWRRRNSITTTTDEVEVIDLMTPSPSCRVGASMKRRRVSEFIDLTMSPNFIEL